LLNQLYQNLLIPVAVANEWGTSCPSWITIQPVQNQALVQALRLQLGPGEAEAIALAIETSAARLILDDQRGRRIAGQMHVTVTGTVGAVLRAKQVGVIPLVRPIFDSLRAAGFRLSDALLSQSLQLAGE
jgi:predicted nucleic acid-binding protein